jgi:hypothetical protein
MTFWSSVWVTKEKNNDRKGTDKNIGKIIFEIELLSACT